MGSCLIVRFLNMFTAETQVPTKIQRKNPTGFCPTFSSTDPAGPSFGRDTDEGVWVFAMRAWTGCFWAFSENGQIEKSNSCIWWPLRLKCGIDGHVWTLAGYAKPNKNNTKQPTSHSCPPLLNHPRVKFHRLHQITFFDEGSQECIQPWLFVEGKVILRNVCQTKLTYKNAHPNTGLSINGFEYHPYISLPF